MKVTMLDVANKAGVSKSTVSRVLNRKNIVRPDVVKRVFDAIQETGYRPNILAQNLAMRKTNFIGFVMSNVLFDGPYFSTLMNHAASFCEETQHQLVMTDGKHSKAEERAAINFLLDMKCAGIIVYAKYLNEKELGDLISSTDTPIMVLNRNVSEYPNNAITTDHYRSACMMVEHIVEKGHTDIAIIRGNPNSLTDLQRYQAYRDTLTKYGLPLRPEFEQQGNWMLAGGYSAAEALLQGIKTPTAILACNDDMAVGAMKALTNAGLTLPKGMSIAGFDNSNIGEYLSPSLSSVSVPLESMIQAAILYILGDHSHSDIPSLSGSLVIRGSIADISN
ncbi:transcriptional regulator [Vibrio sp. 10N.286.49.C2]|uniref:LacI family DNA-binding transcriptional regulator n=1 Tax=unclassified Vibrio TaxID=2614977 RepID=UPI000C866A4E|nr:MULTISPECIES: LacI family DNA-binding transcriptional regulator [unclassified Vibrio]PMH26499.1 transcriptional regulator [Vibrio sp. 10N.286.49.C2]PMH54777.1 transcriptional regulator [Vibrio sp. 10N.286.49.B1]PMH82518.1 transcriptional regulator [Vibrio sp. 10N.286.48.B7]